MRKYLSSFFLALFFLILNPLPSDTVQLEEEKPEVHILMPAYNAGPLVLTSVKSVLGQTYPKKQLFIWDDGSTDDTAVKICSFQEETTGKAEQIALKSSPL